ncbi:hypothetical protein [Malonomonas rubra]|uniref:hypothetical protein n=1 Tax=Malonomonas rubra TaxID=57040 RepID=UPI0026F03F02|nr:hypothetical protein [Malonomonas rubra]
MKKMLRNALIALFTCSSSAFAASTATSTEGGFLLSLFIGFFSLILVFQLVPATIMLIGMIKGLWSGKTQIHY